MLYESERSWHTYGFLSLQHSFTTFVLPFVLSFVLPFVIPFVLSFVQRIGIFILERNRK
jgi:hypothetical protein